MIPILPPTPRKAVLNPKTGKYETVSDYKTPTPEDLERARREVKDRIAGNEQFHEDPFKTPEPPPPEADEYDGYLGCYVQEGKPASGLSMLFQAHLKRTYEISERLREIEAERALSPREKYERVLRKHFSEEYVKSTMRTWDEAFR